MNQEVNDFLMENLKEAHETFNNIIREIEENNIVYETTLKDEEKKEYQQIYDLITKMNNHLNDYNYLFQTNSDIIDEEYIIYIKYISLYITTIILIKLLHEIFDTKELNDIIKYFSGLFLGSTYIGLLNKDINELKDDTKEKRDLFNKLKTLKEEYKENHDQAVCKIDYIYALNTKLWKNLDNGKKLVKNK